MAGSPAVIFVGVTFVVSVSVGISFRFSEGALIWTEQVERLYEPFQHQLIIHGLRERLGMCVDMLESEHVIQNFGVNVEIQHLLRGDFPSRIG